MASQTLGEMTVVIRADSSQFNQGMNAVNARLNQAATLIKTAFQFAIIKKAVQFIGELNTAFGESEISLIRLTQAAKNNPLLNSDFAKSMEKYATQMQRITGINDEEIKNQIAFAAGLGRTEEQIKKITLAAANWAATGNIEFSSAFITLTRTYSGQLGMIGRLIPGMRELTRAELESGAAVEFIGKKFAGMAETVQNSLLGTRKNFANAMDDLKESAGKATSAIEILFNNLGTNIARDLSGSIDAGLTGADTNKWLRDIIFSFLSIGLEIKNFFSRIGQSFAYSFSQIIRTIMEGLVAAKAGFINLFGGGQASVEYYEKRSRCYNGKNRQS